MNSVMLKEHSLSNLASKAADHLLTHGWKMWFWGDSVGFEGLLDATELTGNEKYSGFVYGFLKGWLAREGYRGKFDYTAPGVALLRTYELTGDTALLEGALRHASYMSSFRKSAHGAYVKYEDAAIELPPELPADHPDFQVAEKMRVAVSDGGPCVFVDCVHFDGPFFAKLHQVTKSEHYCRLALENIVPQVKLLFDQKESLFHHFWMERTESPNGVFWGRGNGWGLLGLARTIDNLSTRDPGRSRLLDVLIALARRLAKFQDSSGGWHTVLDDPDSYIETSIAAFVVDAFSLAIIRGWLDENEFRPVLDLALAFLLDHVQPDGVLSGVSYETFPSTRAEHYRRMPRNAMVPWGQGPLLTALRSFSRLLYGKME